MSTFTFTLPRCILVSQNDRDHYKAKAAKTAQLRAIATAKGLGAKTVTTPCTLDVLVGWPTRRRRDRINVSPTVKALVDGLVSAGVLVDDSDDHIVAETYRSHHGSDPKQTEITLTFTSLEDS